MQSEYVELRKEFAAVFGASAELSSPILIIRAPGRVNLIGEHTDYNDGFVFPMAIEPQVMFVFRGRQDGLIRLTSTIYPKKIVEFSVQKKITRGEPSWANYPKGVAAELIAAG